MDAIPLLSFYYYICHSTKNSPLDSLLYIISSMEQTEVTHSIVTACIKNDSDSLVPLYSVDVCSLSFLLSLWLGTEGLVDNHVTKEGPILLLPVLIA